MYAATKTTRPARLAIAAAAVLGSISIAPTARASDVSEDRAPASHEVLMKTEPKDVPEAMDSGHDGHVTRAEFLRFQEQVLERIGGDAGRRGAPVEFTDQG